MTPEEKRASEARKQAREWFKNMFGNRASVSRANVIERVSGQTDGRGFKPQC